MASGCPFRDIEKEKSPSLPPASFSPGGRPFSSGSGTAGLCQSRRITLGQSPPLSGWRVAPLKNKGVGPDLSPRPHDDYGPDSPRISSVIFNRALSQPVPQFPHLWPEINTCSVILPSCPSPQRYWKRLTLENQWEELPVATFKKIVFGVSKYFWFWYKWWVSFLFS